MEKEKIKCICEYLQDIKININELNYDKKIYDDLIESTTEDQRDIILRYNLLFDFYEAEKIKFYIKSIITLGIYYHFKKNFYKIIEQILLKLLDVLDDVCNNMTECLNVYKIERDKLYKKALEYDKYRNQIEMYLNSITDEKSKTKVYGEK